VDPVVPLSFHPSGSRARATGKCFIYALRQLLSSLKDICLTNASPESSFSQAQLLFYTIHTNGGCFSLVCKQKAD